MKKYEFLCLDDDDTVKSLIRTLNKRSELVHIELKSPLPFAPQKEAIITLDKESAIDGLLLDLRLDQFIPEGQEGANYRAAALAQELRTLATEKKISAFPVFLWSIDAKLSKSFEKDSSSQALFDLIIVKESVPDQASSIAQQFASVTKAYKDIEVALKKSCNFADLLKLNSKKGPFLDVRVGEEFSRTPKSFPIHAYANYIFARLIEVPGPLINQSILCARLGLDIKKSSDISTLLEILDSKCGYKGPFGDGWKRWWWMLVEQWWKTLKKDLKPMTSLPASMRVEIMKEHLSLKGLVAAQPRSKEYGSYFSTVCKVLDVPLDPIDGFVIALGSFSWQDKSYISKEVALAPTKYDVQFELDPLEKERLHSFKKRR